MGKSLKIATADAVLNANYLKENLDKTYLDIIKGLNEEQAKLALSTTKLSKTKQQQLLIDAGISSLSEEITLDKAQECIVNSELNDELKESIVKKMAEASASNVQADGSKVVSRENLKEIIATSELNKEEKEAILVNLGYGTSNIGLAATFKTLTAKIWGAVKALGYDKVDILAGGRRFRDIPKRRHRAPRKMTRNIQTRRSTTSSASFCASSWRREVWIVPATAALTR